MYLVHTGSVYLLVLCAPLHALGHVFCSEVPSLFCSGQAGLAHGRLRFMKGEASPMEQCLSCIWKEWGSRDSKIFQSIVLLVERSQVSTPGYLESTRSTAWRITQLSTAEVLCIHAHDSDLLRYFQLLPNDPPMPFQKRWKCPSLEDFVLSLGCDLACARQVSGASSFNNFVDEEAVHSTGWHWSQSIFVWN